MSKLFIVFCLFLGLGASKVAAEMRPQAEPGGDPHIQFVLYDPAEVVVLEVATGYQVAVQFSRGEKVESVATGDSESWQVSPSNRGDYVFIKSDRTGQSTNLVVVTDVRTYAFLLKSSYSNDGVAPYLVRFKYPPSQSESRNPSTAIAEAKWKITGDKLLRPTKIEDDGTHIYIHFPQGITLPAIFAIQRGKEEELINGMMRNGVMVVDELVTKLKFRLNRKSASAIRIPIQSDGRK